MSTTGLVLAAVGAVLLAIGGLRARDPWSRYRALKSQQQNIARYEAWRGGLRDDGPTGASVAMDMLRSRLRTDVAIAGAGIVAILAGIFVK